MISFADMKRKGNKLSQLTEKLNAISDNKKGFEEDARFWTLTVDKQGNGYAVIRFLPAVSGEEMPFVRKWEHGFKGPTGGWYIEQSLTTIGKEDPVAEMNTRLWDQGEHSEGRDFVSKHSKRRLYFVSNIYVVKDPAHPENEGKVFLFKYGKKIYDKIFEAANPKFDDVVAFDPFDFWEGANFKLKAAKVEGYRNYDRSEWDLVENEEGKKAPRGPLLADDAKLEKIWKSEYSLQGELDPKNYKTYNQLAARLAKVMGHEVSTKKVEDTVMPAKTMEERFAKSAPTKDADEDLPWGDDKTVTVDTSDDDDDLGSFRSLVD